MNARTPLLSLALMVAATFGAHAEQACKTTVLKNPAPTIVEMYALAEGYGVMIGTAAAPSNRHATWNINFYKEGAKDGGIPVLVDANTGTLEKVIK